MGHETSLTMVRQISDLADRNRELEAENARLREALKELEKYADNQTSLASTKSIHAEQDGDSDFERAHEYQRRAYSDMTMKIRATLNKETEGSAS